MMAPAPLAEVVDGRALRAALSASWRRPTRDDIHHEPGSFEVEAAGRNFLDAEENLEYCSGAQGGAWAEDVDTRSLVSSPARIQTRPGNGSFPAFNRTFRPPGSLSEFH
jgi:hypothetical protein